MGYYKRFSGLSQRAYKKEFGGNQPVEIEFAGVDELMEILQKLPLKFAKKPLVATLKKGTNEFNKALRKNTPSNLSELKKIIKTRAGKGNQISVKAGFFHGLATVTTRSGQEWDPYYLLYWSNYGTLKNRHSGHSFDRGRKAISSNWNGGIRPKLFVESSWAQSQTRAQDKINSEFQSITERYLNKHKVSA
jgi:hypothetical protein